MAIEPIRGCGYRKVGGLYLVSEGRGRSCSRLPAPLLTCPTCSHGFKQSRGFTWVDAQVLLNELLPACMGTSCEGCPMADIESIGQHAGLLWVGKQYYPTPRHFLAEAVRHGISRRVPAVPKDFVVGEHWIILAHPEVFPGKDKMQPGMFYMFKPTHIETIVTESFAEDNDAMNKLRKRGLTPVIVPDGDPDHDPHGKGDKAMKSLLT